MKCKILDVVHKKSKERCINYSKAKKMPQQNNEDVFKPIFKHLQIHLLSLL